jgi:hypothetical protein
MEHADTQSVQNAGAEGSVAVRLPIIATAAPGLQAPAAGDIEVEAVATTRPVSITEPALRLPSARLASKAQAKAAAAVAASAAAAGAAAAAAGCNTGSDNLSEEGEEELLLQERRSSHAAAGPRPADEK